MVKKCEAVYLAVSIQLYERDRQRHRPRYA